MSGPPSSVFIMCSVSKLRRHIIQCELTLTYSKLEKVSMLSMRYGSCSLSSLNSAKAWSMSLVNTYRLLLGSSWSHSIFLTFKTVLKGNVKTSDVVVGHSNLRDDVGALGEAGINEVLVLLQSLFDHLELGVHVGHEEVFNPAVRKREGLQL